MGMLADIIKNVSDDVVAALAAASYPALVDGGIVVGTAAEFEQAAPPRIIFDLSPGSKFSAPDYASNSTTLDTDERRKQIAMRTIANEDVLCAVHCWGAAGTGVPVDDYDVTRALYHAVRGALQRNLPGAHAIDETGKYRTGTNIVRLGRWYTFGVTIYTPVLDTLLPYDRARLYAPDDVIARGTDRLVLPNGAGASEEGCS